MVSGLVKLERLSIVQCSVMEELFYSENGGAAGVIRFQKLKFLYLSHLPKLVGCCNSTNVIELPQLVSLTLSYLPNFTTIYPDNRSSTYSMSNNISVIQRFFNKEVVIPKLEELSIDKMEKLKCIWPCHSIDSEEVEGCILRKIEVKQCDNIVNLFPTNPMPWLRRLETLDVWYCSSIEVLFDIDVGCVGEIEEDCRSSLRYIGVYASQELREVWRLRSVSNPDHIISGFQAVEKIQIYGCRSFRNLFTPTIASFDLGALVDIMIGSQDYFNESVERSQEINDISKGEIVPVDDIITNVAFPFHLIPAFHHLQKLHVQELVDVEVVFEIDGATSSDLVTARYNQLPPLFPHLTLLRLSSLEKLKYVWKCSWNNILFTQKEQESSFQELTDIEVYGCRSLKYLFSPFMIKLLSNLEIVTISRCDGIEELISNRDHDVMAASTSCHTNTHRKLIDGGGARGRSEITSNITSSTTIHDHVEVDGASVFPFHEVGKLQKLDRLMISSCPSMRMIFEIEGVNNTGSHHTNVGDEHGGDTHSALAIQRSTKTTLLQLPNLKILKINKCDLLEHLFTISTLESLKQLKELAVKECTAMQVILKEDGEHTTSKTFAFPCLKSLTLADLPNIKSFFLGMNEFQWPVLDEVRIYGCPQMTVFTSGHSITPELKYMHTGLGKHSLECGLNFQSNNEYHETQVPSSNMFSSLDMIKLFQSPWSFTNLIEVNTERDNKWLRSSILFPYDVLLKLQNLEKLHVDLEYVDPPFELEEIFEIIERRNDDVNEKQSVVVFPKLKEVTLTYLKSLRHMGKSNRWVVMNFPNLTNVFIKKCPLLGHVITNCMVGSLLQLQELQIINCKNMEVIIKQVKDYETSANEVVLFPCLKSIKLGSLPKLEGFCLGKEDFLWQSLDTLEIKCCPQITVFTSGKSTTPELKVIDTTFGLCYATEDPTSFIKSKQQEGLQF